LSLIHLSYFPVSIFIDYPFWYPIILVFRRPFRERWDEEFKSPHKPPHHQSSGGYIRIRSEEWQQYYIINVSETQWWWLMTTVRKNAATATGIVTIRSSISVALFSDSIVVHAQNVRPRRAACPICERVKRRRRRWLACTGNSHYFYHYYCYYYCQRRCDYDSG